MDRDFSSLALAFGVYGVLIATGGYLIVITIALLRKHLHILSMSKLNNA